MPSWSRSRSDSSSYGSRSTYPDRSRTDWGGHEAVRSPATAENYDYDACSSMVWRELDDDLRADGGDHLVPATDLPSGRVVLWE